MRTLIPLAFRVVVGDGGNDVCPAQRLRFHDVLFVRQGYQLEDFISSGLFRETRIYINSPVVYFTDASAVEANMEIPTTKKSC